MLQKAGGLFQLLAEVDFGTSYGVKSLYFKSRAAIPASTGVIRLGSSDIIAWRNAANDDDLELSIDGTDLNFNGTSISIGGDPVQTEITVSDTATINLSLPASDLTADIVAGSIDNSLISASAAIAFSKLASLSSGNILVGSAGNVATSVSMSGDITISNAGVTAIGTNKVSNAMLAQMPTLTIKGNNTGGTANALDLTGDQVTPLLSNFVGDSGSGGIKGLVPAPAAGDAAATKFLMADGTWTTPSGSGDVVGPASATNNGFAKFDGTTGKLLKNSAATISNADINASAAISFSKLESLASANLLVGSGSNVATAVSVTGDISISNTGVTSYNGTVPINKGGTGQVTQTAGFDSLSPTTTKGDIIVDDGTNAIRLGVGSNFKVLTSKSSAGPGVSWESVTSQYVAVRASRTTAQSVGNGVDVIIFDNDSTSGNYDLLSSYNTANGQFVAPYPGIFLFTGAVGYAANATGYRGVAYDLNSGTEIYNSQIINAGGSVICIVPFSFTVRCALNDVVRVLSSQGSGGSLNVSGGLTYLNISTVYVD